MTPAEIAEAAARAQKASPGTTRVYGYAQSRFRAWLDGRPWINLPAPDRTALLCRYLRERDAAGDSPWRVRMDSAAVQRMSVLQGVKLDRDAIRAALKTMRKMK